MRAPPNAPVFYAVRRVRSHPFTFVGIALAIAAAGGLLGWSSLTAATSQEDNVRTRVEALRPAERALQVTYFALPLEADAHAQPVADAVARFANVTRPAQRVQISHSIDPGDPLGTRVVVAGDPAGDVVLAHGRLPMGCGPRDCEALALRPGLLVGQLVRLGPRLHARIVGVGSLLAGLISDPSDLGTRPLLVRALSPRLAAIVSRHGSTVVTTAALDPHRVHGYALSTLTRQLRETIARLERGDPLVRATAPIGVLDDLDRRGTIARRRLLIVAGEGAALIVAFAAFVAVARRRETELVQAQLTTLGASRGQAFAARALESLLPALVGTALALGGSWLAARIVAHDRGLPAAFAGGALPTGTTLTITGVCALSAALLVVAVTPRERARFGFGVLETSALVALGLIVWQLSTTGALDPDQVGRSGAAPVVVLAPALAFFVVAVILLRLVPPALRLAVRATQRAPFVRLTFLTAARNPSQVAAATTFLAVALGAALFSLDYRATIDTQARDQARFAVGAAWRVPQRNLHRGSFRRLEPVSRLDGALQQAYPAGADRPVDVLALPARDIARVTGWRDGFSQLSRDEIARQLRPHPIALTGPKLDAGAREVRVWARAKTDYPREIVLHVVRPDQRFGRITLGIVWRRWRLLRAPVPPGLRGGLVAVVHYVATQTPISFKYDPEGFVDLGPIEQRTASGWTRLPSIGAFTPTTSPDGTSGVLFPETFAHAPVRDGVRFEVNGTRLPLAHAPSGLPDPLPGFQTGPLPGLVSRSAGAESVDRLLTLDVAGKLVPVRVVGTAQLFPSVVGRPHDFVVLDYDTLFAALNADQPGILTPTEGWSFAAARPQGATLGAQPLEHSLRSAPLAAGTRRVLTVTGIVAAVLALVGLILATRSALAAERLMLAEYEALGVAPRVLRRSAQLRVLVVSALGIVAGIAGGAAGVALIGSFVAVTGTARRPLPPIASVVAWAAGAVVIAALLASALATAALVAGRALGAPAGRRLRA